MSVVQIPQHKHCLTCGRAHPADQQYCSTKCEEDFVSMQKRKKKVLIINYSIMIFFVFLLILL